MATMTSSKLLDHAAKMAEKAHKLMANKNHDYAGSEGVTPFKNFTMCEAAGICPTEKGILVRMTDKMSRLANYLDRGELKVTDESFDDTLLDLINYSIILSAYMTQKREELYLAQTKRGEI